MDELQRDIEVRVEALGFELVELEQAGSRTRPLLRLRIDRPEGAGEAGVTIDDCTRVSRDVEAMLDARGDLSERYVLEVSSPGLERPLTRRHDYQRFAGKEVALRTSEAVPDVGKHVNGLLRGIDDNDVVTVEVNGAPVAVALGNIKKAHLVFRWEDAKKK